MKSIKFFIFILLMGSGTAALAQDYQTGIGLRAGTPYGLTVKHFMSESNALEGILASRWESGFIVTGLYQRVQWTGEYPGLNWYYGVGAHLGFFDSNSPFFDGDATGSVIGVDGVIGLEYTFDEFPINLGLDWIPSINLVGNTGWAGLNLGLSVRYVF